MRIMCTVQYTQQNTTYSTHNRTLRTVHTTEHYDHHTQKITTTNISRNKLPATTKPRRTSHRTHNTKNHKLTLTLTSPSLQNDTTNVVNNLIVASS